jgi:hypothetical protein
MQSGGNGCNPEEMDAIRRKRNIKTKTQNPERVE